MKLKYELKYETKLRRCRRMTPLKVEIKIRQSQTRPRLKDYQTKKDIFQNVCLSKCCFVHLMKVSDPTYFHCMHKNRKQYLFFTKTIQVKNDMRLNKR